MGKNRLIILAILAALPCSPLLAQKPIPFKKPEASQLLQLLTGTSTDAFAGALRGFLVRSLPEPLYESKKDWGKTKPVRQVKWKGQGFDVHTVVVHEPKNDGKWKQLRVAAVNPADTMVFDLRDVAYPEAGRMTFTAFLSMDARVEYVQQNWRSGTRLYSGSARARFRVQATLQCEACFRLEAGELLLPDAVFRLRVLHSDVRYDNFVMEHIAGVGGEAAKVLGDAGRGGLKQWHPGLERDLIAKANAAIEKAGDTKEVRLSAYQLLKKKAPAKP